VGQRLPRKRISLPPHHILQRTVERNLRHVNG
jgi:hypothetical protein